jgi:predicted  nucleic acid-binding Zn-ribbon protein
MMSLDRRYSEITFDTKEEMSLDLDYSDNARAGLLENNRSTSKLLLGIDKIKRKGSIRQKKKVVSLDAYERLQWELVAANQTIVAKESEITFLNFQVSARESTFSILTSKIDTLEQTIKAKEKEIQALRSKKEADDTKRLKKRQLQASSIATNGIETASRTRKIILKDLAMEVAPRVSNVLARIVLGLYGR